MSEELSLPKVCRLLNAPSAKYLIVGAQAAILHGYVRDTHDVDILIPEDIENHAAATRSRMPFAPRSTA